MATKSQTHSKRLESLFRVTCWSLTLVLVVLVGAGLAQAQGFTSGSTGADGALDFSGVAPGTIVIFDPAALRDPPLDPEGDSVYHFTTINIPADVTVRLRADVLGSAPVHWLATGAVQIDGTLDVSGEPGHPAETSAVFSPAVPGPGGFPGGIGARVGLACQPGFGPGGGFCSSQGNGGSYGTRASSGGTVYGNLFILPLTGGSGGGGANLQSNSILPASGGGAGGGAILIASSVSITITGVITARGGAAGTLPMSAPSSRFNIGGPGSGGAVRLLAPIVTVEGTVTVAPGPQGRRTNGALTGARGGNGRLRIESETLTVTGTLTPTSGPVFLVTLVPSTVIFTTGIGPGPTVRVVSVAGVAVPTDPTGSFTAPDLAINSTAPVTMVIAASNIPPGAVVTLTLLNENTGAQTVTSTALVGTLANSAATASATFSVGVTQVLVRSTFTP